MTREEAINQLQDAKDGYKEYLSNEALDMAIKALEQEPCDDAISRKELLKIYEDRFSELQKLKHLKDNKGAEDRQMGVNYCINVLKALPSVISQEPRWIPVSERYPKPEDEYKIFLVTDEEGVISVQTFYMSIEKEPQPYFSGMVNVVAWMPLPTPFKPQESEDADRSD